VVIAGHVRTPAVCMLDNRGSKGRMKEKPKGKGEAKMKEASMGETRTVPSDTLAPWAETVPRRKRATVDELLVLPDDGWRYEVVEGVLVRMAGSGEEATTIAFNLGAELRAFARPRRLGVVTGADGVYKFPGAETGLLPDVGFYAAERRALIVDRSK